MLWFLPSGVLLNEKCTETLFDKMKFSHFTLSKINGLANLQTPDIISSRDLP